MTARKAVKDGAIEAANRPDALGNAGRAILGARLLQNIQTNLTNLKNQQITDGFEDDELVPGILVRDKTVTFAGRREQLQAAINNLIASHDDIKEEFERAVEKVRQEVEMS